ncbi:MAG: hypothetical protein GJ680_00055 [Alteromonadaceae bacterium]|nr:hypothetical protein [Alteromonadaceae bacterium]
MKNIVILTSNELRHTFMRKAIALDSEINVLASYCEKKSQGIRNVIKQNNDDAAQLYHIESRARSEADFFGAFVNLTPDNSAPQFIEKGEINSQSFIDEIIELKPDLVIAYGCSIIKPQLINHYKDRFLNVHLGLSPYYRGGGTNFFPLVNRKPEYVGATFMYIDEGIDTGDIIHQIRAEVHAEDGPHQIGNRLISKVALSYIEVIKNFDKLVKIEQPKDKKSGLYYSSKDFTPDAVREMYKNFSNGMVEEYLELDELEKAPLFVNPILANLS